MVKIIFLYLFELLHIQVPTTLKMVIDLLIVLGKGTEELLIV